jgi:hypothetical protein
MTWNDKETQNIKSVKIIIYRYIRYGNETPGIKFFSYKLSDHPQAGT